MPVNAELKSALAALTKEVSNGSQKASEMAVQTKREFGKLQNALLLNPHQVDEITFGRELYEQCAFLAVKQNDLEAFERQVSKYFIMHSSDCSSTSKYITSLRHSDCDFTIA